MVGYTGQQIKQFVPSPSFLLSLFPPLLSCKCVQVCPVWVRPVLFVVQPFVDSPLWRREMPCLESRHYGLETEDGLMMVAGLFLCLSMQIVLPFSRMVRIVVFCDKVG